MTAQEHAAAPSCLRCEAPLVEAFDASARCPSCGEVNLRVDLETYWTRSPRAIASEEVLRLGGCAVIVMAMTLLSLADVRPYETGWKVYALMGALIPMGLWWDLVGIRTRRSTRYRAEILMPAACLVIVAAPLLWAGFQVLSGDGADFRRAGQESLVLGAVALPTALAARLFVLWVQGLQRGARESKVGSVARRRESTRVSPRAVRSLRAARGVLDARPSSSYRRLNEGDRTTYCLHCFAPIPGITVASQRCDACGQTTRRLDAAVRWNLSESFLERERRAKRLGVAVAALLMALVAWNAGELNRSFLWGSAFTGGLVAVLLIGWWDLSGLWTRHRTTLYLEFLAPVLVACTGFAYLGASALIQRGRQRPFERDFWDRAIVPPLELPSIWWALLTVPMGAVLWIAMQRVLAARERLIQRRVGGPSSSMRRSD